MIPMLLRRMTANIVSVVALGLLLSATTGVGAGLSTDSLPPQWLLGPDPDAKFGYAVSTGGDVNGDGFADLIVGGYSYDTGNGRAYLYLGSAAGFGQTPEWEFSSGPGDWFGYAVDSAGDFNGDGFDDLLVSAWQERSGG